MVLYCQLGAENSYIVHQASNQYNAAIAPYNRINYARTYNVRAEYKYQK